MNWTVLWTLSFTLLAMTVVQEIGSTIRPPQNISIRQFDRTPTQSCAVTTIELAYVAGGFRCFLPFVIQKVRVAAARKLNRRRTRFH